MKDKHAEHILEIEKFNRLLPELLEKLARGENVVFTRNGSPVARLVPVGDDAVEPRAEAENDNGIDAGAAPLHSDRCWSPRDFDAPLPKDLTKALERCACLPLARAECEGKKH